MTCHRARPIGRFQAGALFGAKFQLYAGKGVLQVMEAHTVPGDVDLSTGNIKFTGNVIVKGSVLSGFSLISGGDILVEQVVQASLLSSDGSIAILQGIKGEGRAIVRTKRDIVSSFAERSVLLAIGDVPVFAAAA